MSQGTLGMVGCEIMEDEMVDVLSRDGDIDTILVIDDGKGGKESEGFIEKMPRHSPAVDMRVVKPDEIPHIVTDGYTVIVWMKPMALHQKPEKLHDDVADTLRLLRERCDIVLLFYGLCGNAFKKVKELEDQTQVPLLILRDSQGQVVDDCIGAVLGGTDEYLKQLKEYKGAFFLTPMWGSNWREMLHKVQIMPSEEDIEGARYVFDAVGYDKVVKIDTGLGDEKEFEEKVDEFARIFDFDRKQLRGDLSLVHQTYEKAKEIVGPKGSEGN